MIERIDLVRAYFYRSVCRGQYERGQVYIAGMTRGQFDLCLHSSDECRKMLGGTGYHDAIRAIALGGDVSIAREVAQSLEPPPRGTLRSAVLPGERSRR